MNLHSIRNTAGARRPRQRVGRGHRSGSGKTCGRGHKGQMARSGARHKPSFEGGQMPLVRRLPKRGFKNYTRQPYLGINVGDLVKFSDGADVTPETLREAGLIRNSENRIKILGDGDVPGKITVKAHAFSAGARAKIEEAGGTCEVIA